MLVLLLLFMSATHRQFLVDRQALTNECGTNNAVADNAIDKAINDPMVVDLRALCHKGHAISLKLGIRVEKDIDGGYAERIFTSNSMVAVNQSCTRN